MIRNSQFRVIGMSLRAPVAGVTRGEREGSIALAAGQPVCNRKLYTGFSVGKDSRDIICEIEADGWRFIGASGSHHHFKHPMKPGKVTIPHPRRDLHPKTVKSIYRQAGLKDPR